MRFSLLILVILLMVPSTSFADDVHFTRDVMAVISRAGCNLGTCHANLNGKGGFKLSLRGENPNLDHQTLTRESAGRRMNPRNPETSLILLKATAQVPHEGGLRFPLNSPEYEIVRSWIAAGAPNDGDRLPALTRLEVSPEEAFLPANVREVKITANAVFADGTRRNVTGLAVFDSTNPKIDVSRQGHVTSDQPGETTVVVRYLEKQSVVQLAFLPDRPGFRWAAPKPVNFADELVFGRLEKLRINPSQECADTTFIRRVHLDLIGVLPTVEETRTFLADVDLGKRANLVDRLLERPEFADWWALKWADLLRVEEKQLDKQGVKVFREWIRKSFADNKPLNEFARELIASRGSTYKVPAANYYRALRDPNTRSEATAQVFLGIRMQCAKCHNHPFNQWTQNDYHQLSAFFARVSYKIVDNNRKDKLDKHEFVGDQEVYQDDSSEVKHPVTGEALAPRYLGKAGPTLEVKADRLLPLADWVADPENPFFAKTQANRIWAYLLGRGLVDPIDDFRSTNPPSNGPLLDALAREFVEHKFDVKHLIRVITTSRTYQRSARPNETNADDETHYSRSLVRPLPAEALLDAIAQATDVPTIYQGYPVGTRAAQLGSFPSIRRGDAFQGPVRFLKVFGKPERLLSCDCERSDASTLAQALTLITGELLNKNLTEPKNRIGKLLDAKASPSQIIDELYLATQSRLPTVAERDAFVLRVEQASDVRAALEDILWALVNSKEFLLRR